MPIKKLYIQLYNYIIIIFLKLENIIITHRYILTLGINSKIKKLNVK